MTDSLFESYFTKDNIHIRLRSAWQVMWIWADFILVGLLILAYFAYDNYQHKSRMQLVNTPKVNDFYFVDYHLINPSSDARLRYIPLKISSIEDDVVTFKIGNIGYDKAVSIVQHVKFDMALQTFFFKSQPLTVTQKTLVDWANKEVIYDISRPTNIYIT